MAALLTEGSMYWWNKTFVSIIPGTREIIASLVLIPIDMGGNMLGVL